MTSTTTGTTTSTTTALPITPVVSVGWSLLAGDLLVANDAGVHVVRNGAIVDIPVSSPVESAFADGTGGLVVLTPNTEWYPHAWPDPYSGGDRVVWRVTTDGEAVALYTTDAPADAGWGPLNLYQVAVIPPISLTPSILFTRREPFPNDEPSSSWDRIWVLPLDGASAPTLVPVETPGEGGVTGLGWLESDDHLLIATESDGGASLAMWTPQGGAVDWSSPAVEDSASLRATTIPGTDLIAFTTGAYGSGHVDLVIFDMSADREVTRIAIVDADAYALVKLLHATRDAVAISRLTIEVQDGRARRVYMPVLVYDLTTGTLSEAPLAGNASLVG